MPPKRPLPLRKVAGRHFSERRNAAPEDEDKTEPAEERAKRLVALLDQRGTTQAALAKVFTENPSIMYQVKQMHGMGLPSPVVADPAVAATQPASAWCVCGNCQTMEALEDNICCGFPGGSCQTNDPDFKHMVLNQLMVAVNMLGDDSLADVLPDGDEDEGEGEGEDEDFDEDEYELDVSAFALPLRLCAHRMYMAYRTMWTGVYGNREPPPSCVVWAIRNKWPSPDGLYMTHAEQMARLPPLKPAGECAAKSAGDESATRG